MYDPIELAKKTKKLVCNDKQRKYYRFRFAPYYGGIATADCVGCCLRCIYCWAWSVVTNPKKYGKFYSPEEVASKLTTIARKHFVKQIRISGNEPTLCKDHLLGVIENIPKDYDFILETNGVLVDRKFAAELSKFENLHVRVSLKGACEEEFERITGTKGEFFSLQLRALKNLIDANVSCHPAILIDVVKKENLEKLKERLDRIDNELSQNLEFEMLIRYPSVMRRLKNSKVLNID